jgi:hypothetical protein
MKVSQFLTCLVASQAISAASIPESNDALTLIEGRRVVPAADIVSPDHTLERRKGGGGRGGGGSSSGGGSGGSGGRSGGSSGRTSTSSNSGGATSAGSGRTRSFAGGRYYGGGAATPYKAGGSTPKGLVAGALILPLAMLAIMPGLWLYSTYPYYYNNPYRFHNQSATDDDDDDNDRRSLWTRQTQGKNETLPVMCVCEEHLVCGCDENDDQTYINDLIGNGSYAGLNKTLITVSDINGTKTLVLNGTLENGTTAPGGTDDDDDSAAMNLRVGKYAGYYAVGVMVLAGVFM